MIKGPSSKINALTGTRAIAALLIIVYHLGTTTWPFSYFDKFFARGNIAVSYFFVLSGFVMCISYKDKPMTYGQYLKRRFARIAPAYYLALFLGILPFLYLHYIKQALALEPNFGFKLALNLFLVQSYVPGYALTLNAPGWSLSVECFFYLLFPFLLLLMKRWRAFVMGGLILFALSLVVHLLLAFHIKATSGPWFELTFYHPIFHLNEFVLGMIGGGLFDKIKGNKLFRSPVSILPVLALVILAVLFDPFRVSYHNGLLAPLFLLIILIAAASEPKALRIAPLVFLGEISYGIYILQRPVYYYVYDEANKKWFHMRPTPLFWLYVLILLTTAILSYYLVEKPLGRKIKSLGSARTRRQMASQTV